MICHNWLKPDWSWVSNLKQITSYIILPSKFCLLLFRWTKYYAIPFSMDNVLTSSRIKYQKYSRQHKTSPCLSIVRIYCKILISFFKGTSLITHPKKNIKCDIFRDFKTINHCSTWHFVIYVVCGPMWLAEPMMDGTEGPADLWKMGLKGLSATL